MHKTFSVKVPLAEIFKTPSVRGISQFIIKAKEDRYASIEPVEKKDYYALSSAQKRLYILQQMEPESTAYNMPTAVILEGGLDKAALKDTPGKLIHRHESLRTSFHMFVEEPVQKIHREVEFEIGYYDLYRTQVEIKVKDSEGTGALAPMPIGLETRTLKNFIRPFDLSKAPLLRVGLIHTPSLAGHRYILMVDMHHIVSDGISMDLFVKEFMSLYSGEELPPLKIQYKDFSGWQKSKKERESIKKQEDFWLREFSEEIPVLNLPVDFARPLIQDFAGRTLTFEIGKEETEKLKHLALTEESTLFMVLLALFNIFLAKMSGQEEIVVGSPTAGRRHTDLEQIIGIFVNTLALRNYPAEEKTFKEFLREVKDNTLKAQENQDYPFEELVEKAAVRDASRNPLFDVMFVLQNMDVCEIDIPGLRLKPFRYANKISKFDLSFYCEERGDGLVFTVEYSTKLFRQARIKRFIRYFKAMVSCIPDNSNIKIWEIEVLSEGEKRQLLVEFNDTSVEYPKDKVIHALFEEQSEKVPDNIAVIGSAPGPERNVYGEEDRRPVVNVTYRELNQQSHRLACGLRERGVEPDTIVGIMVERSLEMIIGILGILKAGGSYLPIEPDYPEERINYMLTDGGAKLLVTTGNIFEDRKIGKWEDRKNLEIVLLDFSTLPSSHLHLEPVPATCLAYVMYTSGSTGKPKGIMVEHTSAVNVLVALNTKYPFIESDAYLLKTSVVFDVAVTELFGWFSGGGKLVILEKDGEKDPQKILEAIERDNVTHINFVPSMFTIFVEVLNAQNINKLSGVKYIFLAGEELSPALVNKFGKLESKILLENIYGPTEATVYASSYPLSEWNGIENISIGKPLQNTKLYILNKYNNLQPVGVVGELCIAGAGLARGYVNNPELTTEKFDHDLWGYQDYQLIKNYKLQTTNYKQITNKATSNQKFLRGGLNQCGSGSVGQLDDRQAQSGNPLIMMPRPHPGTNENQNQRVAQHIGSPRRGAPGGRRQKIYKTGDLTQWLPDGNIEFLGRIDSQVKIRGFRIELGEIESRLLEHEDIKEAVVIARTYPTDKADKYLCAYITAPGGIGKAPAASELREFLFQTLPSYMIPPYFVELEKIPLTPSGKVDRKALSAPEVIIGPDYVAPRDEVEEKLAAIWSEIVGLKKDVISIDANFFELGGHSLKAAILVSRIHKEFNVKMPLAEIFKTSAIRRLAEFIKGAAEHKFFSINVVEEKEYYFLSSAQKRLYILQQMELNNTSYNMPQAVLLEGESDKKKLEYTFRKLIERHESFRTSFVMVDREPVQQIHHRAAFEIEYHEVEKQKTLNKIVQDFIRPFDLSKAPLIRTGLIRSGKKQHVLMVDMHHIISDGISMIIIIKEFTALYSNAELPGLPLQYKDYSQWQNRMLRYGVIKKQEEYWLNRFNGKIPVLNFPGDYSNKSKGFGGDTFAFSLDRKLSDNVYGFALETGATLYMVLLAVFNIMLSKYTYQEDIVVGTPNFGRNHADLQNIIGMFVNMLPMRNYPLRNKTFAAFLKEVKENALDAYENQDYQFEQLVWELDKRNDGNPQLNVNTVFAFENAEAISEGVQPVDHPEFTVKPYEILHKISKFDLALVAHETGDGINLDFEYSRRLFRKQTIKRMAKHLINILDEVTAHPQIKISEINMLSEEEKIRLIEEIRKEDHIIPVKNRKKNQDKIKKIEVEFGF
jgi:amino acid adenylation domain-containing protein